MGFTFATLPRDYYNIMELDHVLHFPSMYATLKASYGIENFVSIHVFVGDR